MAATGGGPLVGSLESLLGLIVSFWSGLLRSEGIPFGAIPVGVLLGYVVYRLVRRVRRQGLLPSVSRETEEFVPTSSVEATLYWNGGTRPVRIPSLAHNPSTAPPRSAETSPDPPSALRAPR